SSSYRSRGRRRQLRLNLQANYVLHGVQARWTIDDPARGAQRASRKRFSTGRFMRELESFAPADKRYRMITNGITPTNRVNPDFSRRALTDQALTTVRDILRVIQLPHLTQDLRQFLGG